MFVSKNWLGTCTFMTQLLTLYLDNPTDQRCSRNPSRDNLWNSAREKLQIVFQLLPTNKLLLYRSVLASKHFQTKVPFFQWERLSVNFAEVVESISSRITVENFKMVHRVVSCAHRLGLPRGCASLFSFDFQSGPLDLLTRPFLYLDHFPFQVQLYLSTYLKTIWPKFFPLYYFNQD